MIVEALERCLGSVTAPRFYETERGFQGELLALLHAALPECGLSGDAIVEQEYQKLARVHGLTIRPDIIIHVPTGGGGFRGVGNTLACELKLAAGPEAAREDFGSLDALIRALDYSYAAFINIASTATHAAAYHGPYRERFHWFAVELSGGRGRVRHARFVDGELVEDA